MTLPGPKRPGSDLARIGGRDRTAARPGPGPIADRLVRQLELTLDRRVGGRMSGDHRGRGHGAGLELDRIRPYEPGDDVRKIDWNATARTLVPQVREDVPDRQLTAWLLLDALPVDALRDGRPAQGRRGRGRRARRRSFRGPPRQPARRRDVRVRSRGRHRRPPAAAAGCSAFFAPSAPSRPRRAAARPRPPARSASSARSARPRASSSSLSDFRGPRDWVPALTEVAGRHAVIALEISDPREDALVDVGELTLIDPETGRTLRVDTGDRRLRTAFDDAAAADRADLALGLPTSRHPPPPTLHRRSVAARARAGLRPDPEPCRTTRMNFLAPQMLLGLLLVPVAIGFYLWAQRRRSKYAVRFTNLDLLANLTPRRPVWRRHLPPVLYLGAIAALLIGLARPTMVVARSRARTPRSSWPWTSRARCAPPTSRRPGSMPPRPPLSRSSPSSPRASESASSRSPRSRSRSSARPPTARSSKQAIDGLTARDGTAMGDECDRFRCERDDADRATLAGSWAMNDRAEARGGVEPGRR